MPRLDAIRQIGVVGQTDYRWRKQYGRYGYRRDAVLLREAEGACKTAQEGAALAK